MIDGCEGLNRELRAIGECDQAIVHSKDEPTLLTQLCLILNRTAGYRMAWIGSVEHDENKMVRPLAWSGDEEYLKKANITWADTERGRGPTGSAARTGKTYFFQDFLTAAAAGPWRESALVLGYRSSIAIPLMDSEHNVFAVLTLYSTEPNYFNSAEIQLLEALADDISFGVIALRERIKRQQAETEVIHLASYPELNPNPVLEIDHEGNIQYANPAAKKDFPLMAEGRKQELLQEMINIIQEKQIPSLSEDIKIGQSWFEQTITYVPATNNFLLYGRNITARKKAETGLMESEEKFSKAFHSSPVGLIITHLPDGRWVDANDTYLKMLEYTREEVIGHTSNDLKLYSDPDKRAQIFQVLRDGGEMHNIELNLRTKNDRIIQTLSSVEKITLQGEEYSLSTNVDISSLKKAEEELRQRSAELEASNKELEAFSYSVSHDLRAPLRSMAGFSTALIEDYADKLDADGKLYLNKIQQSSELMAQLIDDLLKLSRVTRVDINYESLDLTGIAQKVVEDLRSTEPNREVKVNIASGLVAQGDRNLIKLVIDNLLGNAWKYTSKTAEAQIEIGATYIDGKNTFFVRDNGVGFNMAYADKLFQPFQRLHQAAEFAGTGIGLATAQRIIRRHGGKIWAESKVGEGATFYFTLN
jgi:PAS domain S-box-containing protein